MRAVAPVRTGEQLAAADWIGKTIRVRGVVTLRDGQLRIRAFLPDGIAILPQ